MTTPQAIRIFHFGRPILMMRMILAASQMQIMKCRLMNLEAIFQLLNYRKKLRFVARFSNRLAHVTSQLLNLNNNDMAHVTPHNETVHKELISKIDNLLDFCRLNNYSHLVLIGKDGQCSRYMEGTFDDLSGMVASFGQANKSFKGIIENSNEIINA